MSWMSQKDKGIKMNKKGQAWIEYFVLACIVISAITAVQFYMKRSIDGQVKANVDQIGGGTLYAPGATVSHLTINKGITESSASFTEGADDNEKDVSTSSMRLLQTTTRDERTLADMGN